MSGAMPEKVPDAMSDNETTTTDATDQTDAVRDDGGQDAGTDLQAAGKKALDTERDARRTAERELKKLQTRITEFENRGKSDSERLTAERDALQKSLQERETRLRNLTARSAVTEAATKAGALSASAVYGMVRDQIEYDDDGEPTNVAALLTSLKKDEPKLFPAAPGRADGGARDEGTGTTGGNDMNHLIRRMAGRA